MPRVQSESYGVGDVSWLGSTHGIANGRTAVLRVENFTANDHYPEGYITSGQPVSETSDGSLAPYSGSGRFAGFVLFDHAVTANDEVLNVAVLDHGRVKVDRLPVDFTVPAAGNDDTTFVYLNVSSRDAGGNGGGAGGDE